MFSPKEIEIGDKVLLKRFLDGNESSIYNFTTLYAWSFDGKIKYDIKDDCLILFFYGNDGGVRATFPIGDGDRCAVAKDAFEYMKTKGSTPNFVLMTENGAKECEQTFGDIFSVYSDRKSADYVYLSEDLINLRGKKFHTKKNHLNAFLNTYKFTYERLSEENIDECKKLFMDWQNSQTNHDLGVSEKATMRLLDNVVSLGVTLGGIRIDGRLVAFSAGEKMTDNTALIHLEYADTNIRGAFNAINQQFCKNEWNDLEFINREEDMGIEGLRKAKMAYRPVKMIEKYFTKYKG